MEAPNSCQKDDYHPLVYVSYFPDSESHLHEVTCLTNYLRSCGFNAILDKYNALEINQQGMASWVISNIRKADKVLITILLKRNIINLQLVT